MKIYAKQVQPEYQDGSYLLDDDYINENCIICGNDRFNGINADKIKHVENAINDILNMYDDNYYKSFYNNFSEACNDILYQGVTHKKYSTKQIHAIKEFCQNYDYRNECENNVFILSLLTGRKWDFVTIRGCCQGDWNILYYSDDIDGYMRNYIECAYFNTGTEWIIHDCNCEPETPDDIDGFSLYCVSWNTDGIRHEIADAYGGNADDVVLYEFNGYKQTALYVAV